MPEPFTAPAATPPEDLVAELRSRARAAVDDLLIVEILEDTVLAWPEPENACEDALQRLVQLAKERAVNHE